MLNIHYVCYYRRYLIFAFPRHHEATQAGSGGGWNFTIVRGNYVVQLFSLTPFILEFFILGQQSVQQLAWWRALQLQGE